MFIGVYVCVWAFAPSALATHISSRYHRVRCEVLEQMCWRRGATLTEMGLEVRWPEKCISINNSLTKHKLFIINYTVLHVLHKVKHLQNDGSYSVMLFKTVRALMQHMLGCVHKISTWWLSDKFCVTARKMNIKPSRVFVCDTLFSDLDWLSCCCSLQ